MSDHGRTVGRVLQGAGLHGAGLHGAGLRGAVLLGGAVLVLAACGGTGTDSASPSAAWAEGTVPTAEQLAAVLVTADDLEGQWEVPVPEDAGAAVDGVVSEEQQEMLPSLELCDEASEESVAAAEGLRWQAFRQLQMTPEDPLDMAGGDRSGHMIFLQEFLLADEPDQVEATFDALRDGLAACLGPIEAGEEGPGMSEELAVPEVGDDRYGVLVSVEEAGGAGTWYLNNALVRSGPVLMLTDVVEITLGEGLDNELDREEIDALITAAAAGIG